MSRTCPQKLQKFKCWGFTSNRKANFLSNSKRYLQNNIMDNMIVAVAQKMVNTLLNKHYENKVNLREQNLSLKCSQFLKQKIC